MQVCAWCIQRCSIDLGADLLTLQVGEISRNSPQHTSAPVGRFFPPSTHTAIGPPAGRKLPRLVDYIGFLIRAALPTIHLEVEGNLFSLEPSVLENWCAMSRENKRNSKKQCGSKWQRKMIKASVPI